MLYFYWYLVEILLKIKYKKEYKNIVTQNFNLIRF